MAVASEELTERLRRLEDELRQVCARLDRLEHATAVPKPDEEAGLAPLLGQKPASPAAGEEGPGMVGLLGRTLLALGGGFLIRALTGGGYVAAGVGVGLGLAYALAWLVACEREAARGRTLSATFHGCAGALLAYPLLWEAVTRFSLLSTGAAAALGAVFLAAVALVAGRRRLAPVNWIAALLALGTTSSLLFATHDVLPVVYGLLALAVVALVLALFDRQPGLRWPVAAGADLAVLVLVWLASRPDGLPAEYAPFSPGQAFLAALSLPAIFFGATVADTLGRARRVDAFAVAQGTLALVLGFGGGAQIVFAQGRSPWGLGLAGLLLGGACYWAAFAFVERRHAHGSSFYFYSSAGGVLVLLGTAILLGREPLAVSWCGLALLMAALGRRYDRMTLRNHASEYLLAAALAGGLVGSTYGALWGEARPDRMGWTALVVLASAVATGLLLGGRWLELTWWQRVPEAVPTALAGLGAAGLVATFVAPWLAPLPDAPAVLATLRTAVLSLLAMGLAEGSRRYSFATGRSLVLPLLALAGLRLIAEDLPRGNPASLFVSFAFYGAALYVAPRRLRI